MGRRVLAVFLSLCLLIATTVGMTTIAGASGIVSEAGIKVYDSIDISDFVSSYTYVLCQYDDTKRFSLLTSFSISSISTNYTVEWYSSQTDSTEGGTLIGSGDQYVLHGGTINNLGDAGTTTYYYYVLTVTDESTGETLATETVGPLAFTVEEHNIVLQGVKEASCTEVGNLGDGYCISCSMLVWEGVRTDPTGHTWDEGTVTKEATCSEKGEITYTCTVCGETYTEEIPAGHTEGETVIENNVSATCTTDGSYDEVAYCNGCGEEMSRYQIIVSATGHTAADPVVEKNVPATCTTDGSYDKVVYCSVCDEELGRETITVPATGHTEGEAVVENEVLATCTEDGSYESVVYCTECNAEISRETVTVEAVGHSYELGVCSVCGAKDPDYVTEVTVDAALAETLTSGLVTGVTIRADIGLITVSEVADDHLLQHIVDVMGFTLNNEAHGDWLLSETESFIIRTTENGRTALKKVTSLFYGDIDFASGATITMELSGSEDLASGTIYVLHYTNGNWQQESYTSSYADGKLTIGFQPDSASPFLIISVSDYTSSRNNILPLLLQIQSLNQTSTSEESTEEVEEEVVEIDEPVEAGETDTE